MSDAKVKEYFEDIAAEFDNIYEDKGNILHRFANHVFRKGMYERFDRTIEECGEVKGKSILDIGCGSGRLALVLAAKGAEVTGIDYSSRMIALANDYLSRYQDVDARFSCCDFLTDFSSEEAFEITTALGVTDYVRDPVPLLTKMRGLTKGCMIVSYPALFTPQTPLRKMWLMARNCPVYFYSLKRLTGIYKSLGISDYEIIRLPSGAKIPTDYLVKALI